AADAAFRLLAEFSPASANETFRLALTDLGQILFLPTLGPTLSRSAPSSRLDVVNLDATTAPEQLRTGHIDLAVSSTPLRGHLRTDEIREDVYCCIARRGRFDGRTPALDELIELPRIVVKDV